MQNLKKIIEQYVPSGKREKESKELFLWAIDNLENTLTRNNQQFHFTASGFVVNSQMNKVLSIYHNIYNSWGWVGGHADGEADLLSVAVREAKEETSVSDVVPLSDMPISIETILIAEHMKNGMLVNEHYHMNVTYLLQADETEELKIKEDENSGVAWLSFDELLERSTEVHMIDVYKGIIKKIKQKKY